jgi:hypothetical protein
MIKIATPISTLFADAETGKRLAAKSDCLECRDLSLESTLPKQELFHFEAELIKQWPEEEREYLRKAIEAKKDLKLATFHAASNCTAPILVEKMFFPGGDTLTREEMIKNARENTAWLRSLGKKFLIGIENNNGYATPAYDIVTDADFISEIVRDNDLQFLFDTAHAHITSINRQVPYETYLAGLPMERLIQIHVTAHGMRDDGSAFDAHEPPTDKENEEVSSILSRYPTLRYCTIEYYRDAKKLEKVLDDYRILLNSHS